MSTDKNDKKKKKPGRKPTGPLGVKRTFYIKPPELLDLLKEDAEKNRRSLSDWLCILLEEVYKDRLEEAKEKDKDKNA